MTQEAQPVNLPPTRRSVEKLCPTMAKLATGQFEEAILRMEAAHILNGHKPEATCIGSAVKYLESLA